MNFKLRDILLAGIILLFAVSVWDICNSPGAFNGFFDRMSPSGAGIQSGRGFSTSDEPQATSHASLEIAATDVKTFELYNPHGNVRVVGADTDKIKVSYTIKIWADSKEEAKKYLKGMSIKLSSEGDLVRVVRKATDISRSRIRGVVVNYNVTAPKALALDLSSNYGTMLAQGFEGDSRFDNRYGSTRIEDMSGSVDLTSRYADLDMRDIGGDADIETAYQNSDIENIGGSLTFDGKYSQVDVSGVGKSVDINDRYGKVDIGDVDGDAKIYTEYSNIEGRHIKGNLDVGARYGNAEFEDVSKDADITTRYGNIRLELANGRDGYKLDSETRNGKIEADGIKTRIDSEPGRDNMTATIGQGKYRISTRSEYGNTVVVLR